MSLPVIEGEDMTKWTISTAMLLTAYTLSAQEGRVTVPKIWDDKALEDWATPIAALGVRPSQITAVEYYAVPGESLRTYPVYRPDREPQATGNGCKNRNPSHWSMPQTCAHETTGSKRPALSWKG
jgi:hypothetical protein